MIPDSELPQSGNILKALGLLALAASRAEARAAQGLYYLLADVPGNDEGAARIAGEFRSFDSLYRLLGVALQCATPLAEILEAARIDSLKRDTDGDPLLVASLAGVALSIADSDYVASYVSENPAATGVKYLGTVKALYDKRNECMHALGIEVSGSDTQLYKRKKDGSKAVVTAELLMEPCRKLRYYPGITLARAIEAVALELTMASASLPLLPVTVQWFRRRGTPLDYAPLVDHYVALATKPLDQQLASLREVEAVLQAKIDAYEAANPNATRNSDQNG